MLQPDSAKVTESAIGRVGEDYLKAIWSALEWGGEPITVSALAERSNATRSTVSINLKRLAGLGLLTHERYRPITLTPSGQALAKQMVRRHRLWETFLVEVLGYGWDEVHEPAEQLEHAAPEELMNRIDTYLGNPTVDPHGDPIPAADGSVRYTDDAVPLSECADGDHEVVRISDANPDVLRRLGAAGIEPGAHLNVATTASPERQALSGTEAEPIPLAADDAKAIIVRHLYDSAMTATPESVDDTESIHDTGSVDDTGPSDARRP